MKHFFRIASWIVVVFCAFVTCAYADVDPDLLNRAIAYDEGVCNRHVPGYGGLVQAVYETEELQNIFIYKGQGDSTMWTATYGASQAYRYAVTGEEEAKQNAIAVVQTLHNHVLVTQTRGYIGRYVGPLADQAFWLDVFQLGEFRYGQGIWTGTFYLSNSSSDQYVGFFHGLAVIHDLVDDAVTRLLIKNMVQEVVDKLDDSFWLILNEEGLPTTAAPGIDGGERCAIALIAAHIIDTPEYWELYEQVFEEEKPSLPLNSVAFWNRYTEYFAMNLKHQNHYHLFRLDSDQERVRFYFENFMDRIRPHVAGMHQTYFDYVYLTGCERLGVCEGSLEIMEDGVEMLRQFPDPPNREIHIDPGPPPGGVDPISEKLVELQAMLPEWLLELVGLDFEVQAKGGYEVKNRCRREYLWQRSPHQMYCAGFLPMHVLPGADYLMAYWMGRYLGYLEPHDIDPTGDDDTADDDLDDDVVDDDVYDDDTDHVADDDQTDDDTVDDDESSEEANQACGC